MLIRVINHNSNMDIYTWYGDITIGKNTLRVWCMGKLEKQLRVTIRLRYSLEEKSFTFQNNLFVKENPKHFKAFFSLIYYTKWHFYFVIFLSHYQYFSVYTFFQFMIFFPISVVHFLFFSFDGIWRNTYLSKKNLYFFIKYFQFRLLH